MAEQPRERAYSSLSPILFWTLLIGTILATTLFLQHRAMIRSAENEARDYFRLNMMYRKWVSNLGGVYASIDRVSPNPYLVMPEREVTTSNGKLLTLINPAYMTSMVFKEVQNSFPVPILNKITSRNPLNPDNAPDEWERAALDAFERGEQTEVSQVTSVNGHPYLRFIGRFATETSCLRCHGAQGYKEGDIRGGLSISVPLESYYTVARTSGASIAVGFALLWGMGSAGILFFNRKRRQYESRLEENEQKFRTVCDWDQDWEYWVDPAGAMVYVSPSVEQITGYPAEAFVIDPALVERVVHPEDRAAFAAHVYETFGQTTASSQMEFRIVRKDGEIRWIHHVCRAVMMDGNCRGMRVSNRDITIRKSAEDALRRSESFNGTLNRISNMFLSEVDEETVYGDVLRIILDVMHSPYGVVGYIDETGSLVCPSMTKSVWSECQMSDKTSSFPSEQWGSTIWGEALRSGVPRYRNKNFKVPEGHVPIHRCLAVPLVDHDRVVGVVTVGNSTEDYTDQDQQLLERIAEYLTPIVHARVKQQQAVRAMQQSHERFALLYSSMSQGMAMLEVIADDAGTPVDYRYLEINPAYQKVLRRAREEIIGRTIRELIPGIEPFWLDSLAEVAVSGVSATFENHVQALDRDYQVFAYSPQPGHVAVLVNDITDMKREAEGRRLLEQQMMQAQKLESLGVLAGGIAHDFNNILTSVIGNAELALLRIGPDSPAADNLVKIEHASMRATELARQMLAYSGKGKFFIESLELNRLIEEMVCLLDVAISKKVAIKYDLAHDLPPIEGDATQLRQVIMNIVINASEAIGETSGVVSIRTGCIRCDRRYFKGMWLEENLTEGLYLFLEISDTGCGMDAVTLSKLFDPFFTTKFTGRGLGMAAVLGIIRGHHGAIKAYSEPGRGTTFKLLFPASNRLPEQVGMGAADLPWKGEGVVLLVDDEETICAIGSEMLRELGFAVVTATNGMEALERYRERDDYRCVILDLTMPHMDGEHAFRELRILKSDVKVILSSGYNEMEIAVKFAGKGLSGFIQKPYKLVDLRDVLKRVLDSPEGVVGA